MAACLLAAALMHTIHPARAQRFGSVLILAGDHYGHGWTSDRLAAIDAVMAGRARLAVEYLNLGDFGPDGDKDARRKTLRDLLGAKYRGLRPDAVITLDDDALAFYGAGAPLLDNTPLIAGGVKVGEVARRIGVTPVAVVDESFDVVGTVKALTATVPNLRRLVVVNGGRLPTTRSAVMAEFSRKAGNLLPAGVEVVVPDSGLEDGPGDLAGGALAGGALRRGAGDAVLLLTHPADPLSRDRLDELDAPIFTVWDAYGRDHDGIPPVGGIVGGCVRRGADIGRRLGQEALRVAAGVPPSGADGVSAPSASSFYKVDPLPPPVCRFDDQRLRHYGAAVEALPGEMITGGAARSWLPDYGTFPEFYWMTGLALVGVVTAIAGLVLRLSARDLVSRRAEALARQRAYELLAFREALDETYDSVFMIDEQTLRFTYANRGALEQLGYQADELLAMTPLDIKPDFDRAAMQALIEPLRRGEKSVQRIRTRYRCKDGTFIPVEVQFQLIAARGGRPGQVIHIVRDISGILAAEAAVRASEERFELALAAAMGGVWDWDLRTNTMWLSPRWKEQLGYRDDEIEHSFDTWKRLIHPDDLAPAMQGFSEYNQGKRPNFDMVLRFRHKNGHLVYIRARAVHQKDDAGNVIRLVGAHSDITDRTVAEARLNESERRLRDLAIAVPGMMFQWIERFDGSHGFTWVSPRSRDIFGFDPPELIADWTRMRVHPEDLDLLRASLETAAVTGVDWEMEGRSLQADGLIRWWKALARPVTGPEGTVLNGIFLDITSERMMREETDRLRNRLDFLLNASPAIICAMAPVPNGRTNFLTAGISQFGYAPATLLAEREWWLTRVHIDDRDAVQQGIATLLATGEPVELSYRFRRADGVWRWVVDHRVLIINAGGGAQEIVGTMTDVTGVVEAEQKARQSQERLEQVLQSAGEGIYGVDRQGHAIFANAATQRMTGYTFAEMRDGRPHMLFHPKRVDGSHYPLEECPIMSTAIDGVERTTSGDVFWRKDGTSFLVDFVVTPLIQDGEQQGAVVVFRDVTEAMAVQADLRRSMSRLEAILANSPVGVAMVSLDRRFLMVNDHFANVVGTRKEELVGQTTRTVYSDDATFEQLQADAYPVMTAGGVYRGELETRRHDGQRLWVHLTGALIELGDEEQGLIWILEDISQRRAQQVALQEKTRELERSNAELEAFAYVASHDLRQPLRAVTSYLKLLERQLAGKLDDDGREFLGFALGGAQRMDRLIVDLLDYSRVGRRSKPFAVHSAEEMVQTALLNLDFVIRDAGATVTVATSLPRLWGDDNELVRLFQNLIGNAVKYAAPDRAPVVTIACEACPDGWAFSIADNGIGIPERQLERVFGIFQRLHSSEAYEGSGIGLAICRKVVERHGGRIWAESVPGCGATFRFVLPAVDEAHRDDA